MKKQKHIETQDLPDGETVFLRKSSLGWKIVYPIKDQNNKIVWMNLIFGGKRNMVNLFIILLLFSLLYFGINELNSELNRVAEDPCSFCSVIQEQERQKFFDEQQDTYIDGKAIADSLFQAGDTE